MHAFTTLAFGLGALVNPSIAGYVLEDDYSPSNFFSMFSFFTDPDPTHGFVKFVDQATAESSHLISSGSTVYMGVDNSSIASGGRNSVRLTSNKAYNHGLIVLDLNHMPEGCGTWPAFWTTGPSWPSNGEIDIIEGVNDQASNAMTLHTGPGCSVNGGGFSGKLMTPDCNVNALGQSLNQGCGISAGGSQTYGSGLNAIDGGVFATEWTAQHISVWFFPRSSIPNDLASGNPNPSSWGLPAASFSGGCDIDNSIKNQQIVFDTTFCGDWAGNTWGSSGCSARALSCNDFVANNPGEFSNAYWSINSLKVYSDNAGSGTSPPVSSIASSAVEPTGIATDLPPVLSSLVPIPVSTDTTPIQATFTGVPWNGQPVPAPPAAAPVQTPAAAQPWNGQPIVASAQAKSPVETGSSQPWNGEPIAAAGSSTPEPAEGDLGWNYFHHSGGNVKKNRRHLSHLMAHRKHQI